MAHYSARGALLTFAGGNQGFPQGIARVAGLRDGGFAVNWIAADNDRTAFDADLYGIVYNSSLQAVGPGARSLISDTGPPNGYPINHHVTALANGGYATIALDDSAYSLAQAAQNRDAVVRFYDASGTFAGTSVNLGKASILGVSLATLSDGRLVTGWVDNAGVLRVQQVSAAGALIGQNIVIPTPAGETPSRPDFTALSNGGWVVTYVAQNAAEGRALFFNQSGQAVGGDRLIASNLSSLQGVQVETLADGRVVMLWSALNNSQTLETRAQIFNLDGSAFGPELLISSNSSSVSSLATLADGGFAIALEPAQDGPLQVKAYNLIGEQVGSTIQIANATGVQLSALADGGFVAVWEDLASDNFHAQAYMASAAGNLTLTGTGNADRIAGREGADTISGLAGVDQLYGGLGNDLLFGGLDNDLLDGGLGNDILEGGAGDDVIIGGSGQDLARFGTIVGSKVTYAPDGTITVTGAHGTDTLTGVEQLLFADTGKRTFASPNSWTSLTSGDQGWSVGDFNGDGKSDAFRLVTGQSGADMLLSTGAGFTAGGSWTGAGSGDAGWHVGDFNGDGRDDIFRYAPSISGADMLLSNGSAFVRSGSWTGAGNGDEGWQVGDFNGDGRDDIFRVVGGTSGADVFLSTGTGFARSGSWTSEGSGSEGWHIGDFNGDGRDDIFRYVPGQSGADMYLSNGTSFVSAGSWSGAGSGNVGWQVGDFNGDGRDDITRYVPGQSGGEVFLSSGSAFVRNGSWTGAGNGDEGWYIADFTGDGTADLMRAFASGAQELG